MNREEMIGKLDDSGFVWDIIVIGGGASGLGAAMESASRGYKTLLLEQSDFAKGTSSRSTKLIHGGVRYLAQGNISLVVEALRERGLLKKNAPHLVKDQSFIIPSYNWWWIPFYTIGLTLYDLLAGKLGIGRSLPLSKISTLRSLPILKTRKLRGGIIYHDCQFDDSRMAINVCQTFCEQGGVGINYMKVSGFLKNGKKLSGVIAEDQEGGKQYSIQSRAVINATGVFVNELLRIDNPDAKDVVKPSQGVHLVVDQKFLGGRDALMIPKTDDGRVLFAVPWHNRVVMGTTDVEKQTAELEPRALDMEVNYILETAGRYFAIPPRRSDVLSVFAGLRPLAAPSSEGKKTKEISRGHKIIISKSGLITLTGGKWTTFRKMGEDVVDRAAKIAGLEQRESVTHHLKIHGFREDINWENPLYWYGSDEELIKEMINDSPELRQLVSEKLIINRAQIIWAVRHEMARTVEDCLSRRTRALQLDAAESIRMAPEVARIIAEELGYDRKWIEAQTDQYINLAKGYLLD